MLCVLFVLFAAGCGEVLGTPGGFSVDENYKLSWTSVERARSYEIEVINVENGEKIEESTRKTSISLAYLAEGDYEIRVKAVAGSNSGHVDSGWSQTIDFQKGYETGCIYTLIDNREYELTKIGSARGVLDLEDVYRGKPVTSIAESAFKGSGAKLESITVGSNVTSIGAKAFWNCTALKSITLPDSLTFIGESAFHGCSVLESITLPQSVTEISPNTFAYCRALASVELGDQVVTIGEGAFSNCSALKTFVIPDSVTHMGADVFYGDKELETVTIGDGLTEIYSSSFYKCSALKTIQFSDAGNLRRIGDSAFSECDALVSITLPKGLLDINMHAFNNASALESVEIPDTVTHVGYGAFAATKFYQDAVNNKDTYIYADDWLIACTEKDTITVVDSTTVKKGVVGIADYAFYAFTQLKEVKIPLTVKYIGEYSFSYCEALYKVTVNEDNSLIKLGFNAFSNCKALYNVQFAYGLQEIDSYAFYKCEMLDNNANDPTLLVPESVTRIGTYAFKDTLLWANHDESGVVYAGNWVVGYEELTKANIELKEGTCGIADLGFYECSMLQTVSRLGQVKYIGIAAFMNCARLSSATLNSNLKTIEDYTFYGCSSLYEIEFPRTLKTIGRSAFYGAGLAEIDLSRSKVETIGRFAFYGNTMLRDVTLGDEVTLIDDYAFYHCSNILTLTVPDSVKRIGVRAFSDCEYLQILSLETETSQLETIDQSAFNGCVRLRDVIIPNSVKTIGTAAFYNCQKMEIELGASLETIGNYAFFNCDSIGDLYIPASVKNIGNYAFRECTNMKSLVLPSTVKNIGKHAFNGCVNMTVYTDLKEIPIAWDGHWNSSSCLVLTGCELSENNKHVVSINVTETTFKNVFGPVMEPDPEKEGEYIDVNPYSAKKPERAGYTFIGWATERDSTEVVYTMTTLLEVPAGTTLYTVWEVAEEVEEEEEPLEDPLAPPEEEGSGEGGSGEGSSEDNAEPLI